uniref:HAT C-terminal dimerisation domain-containing protein n=1 Tax=Meloidogyne enterolobii TaxID=390850 RepID=A0A6V7V9M6_MELEN|nr:unnamed protein product [Meloidogyne enterolobii]
MEQSSSSTVATIDENLLSDDDINNRKMTDIITSLRAKSPWESDGEKTQQINKSIIEFICADIQPLSVVDNIGFKRLMTIALPKYNLPSRFFFTNNMLPKIYEKVEKELNIANFVSITCDTWSSRDGAHSLLSVTGHYIIDGIAKFIVLGAKPIKGRHTAAELKELLRFVLNNFEIEEKIFLIVRDSAEVMIKVANDLGFKSIDCFAHKLNLVFLICPIGFYNFQSIWDGMRIISDENNLKCLIERIKKFVRKLRKSKIQRNEFENIQKIIELPQLILIKDSEVRWSSTFDMLDRFISNRQAISLLSAKDPSLPKFSSDDWAVLLTLKQILLPIYKATNELQKRSTSISSIIPLFKLVCFSLEKTGELMNVKKSILEGLKKRMGEKFDASGSLKRLAWEDNRELVLSTIIDPRFKLSPYLPNERHLEYTNWLIEEAEKVSGIRDQQLDEENVEQELDAPQGMESLAAEFEENMASSVESLLVAPLPSPSELNVRQRAEVEVNDYLHTKKLPLGADPFSYWFSQNAIKWPMLSKLSTKLLSAPASSSESERVFSTTGLIVSNLRKSLKVENVEKLLFLHHNMKIFNFDYE